MGQKHSRLFGMLIVLSLVVVSTNPVSADVVLFKPEQKKSKYPTSRFGKPPARRSIASESYSAYDGPTDSIEPISTQPSQSSSKLRMPNSASTFSGGEGVQEVAIIASDLGFFPKTVFVNRNIPVRIYLTSTSSKTLCFMMDSFQVKKQVQSKKLQEISFVANTPGQYDFYCPINGSNGKLIVKEFKKDESPTPTVASK